MIPALIFFFSAIIHFINFGRPLSVVFDEVFYGDFMASYWQGSYFFDIHPPFVKLLFAFVGKIIGADNYIADWSHIGNMLPDTVIYLRIIPMIAGCLLPIIIYAICRKLDFSKVASSLVAILICLENSLVVQSRFILPDIIMLFTGFSAILCYFEYSKASKNRTKSLFFAASAILVAITLSIKWTGLTFLFLIIVMEFYRLLEDRQKKWLKKILPFSLNLLVISAFMYISLFAVHFSLLPFSGKGDNFMSVQFQKTLIGNPFSLNKDIAPENFTEKFLELNRVMFTSNSKMTATHPFSSEWYTWPLMQRTVFYWQDSDTLKSSSIASSTDARHSYIYLLGNPFIYWLSAISIIFLIIFGFFELFSKKKMLSNYDGQKKKTLFFLIVGYLVNFLPFILIGRVMFLYHYETALIFAIISIAFFVDFLNDKKKTAVIVLITTVALIAFIYWSPFTYGTPITNDQLVSRMWLPSWR